MNKGTESRGLSAVENDYVLEEMVGGGADQHVDPSPRGPRWARAYRRRLLVTDTLVIAAVLLAAMWLRFGSTHAQIGGASATDPLSTTSYATFSIGLFMGWMLLMQVMETRSTSVLGTGPEEYKRVAVAVFRVFSVVAIGAYLLRAEVARGFLALAFPLGLVALVGSRWLWRRWLLSKRSQGRFLSPVILVGDALHVVPNLLSLTRSPSSGYRVAGVCVPDVDSRHFEGLAPVLGRPDCAAEVALRHRVDGVIISSTASSGPALVKRIAWGIEGADIDLMVSSALTDVAGPRIHSRPVEGLPLIHVEEPRFEGGARVVKGLFERSVALVGLTLLSPLFLVIAVLVKRSSRGPVFYRQTRVGLRGQHFTMFKFRSMVDGADAKVADLSKLDEGNGVLFKLRHDPRVTPVGSFLRRWSLDELPQLINVLNGSMALVGPRPPLPREVEKYAQHVHRRLLVKPGITGLWQVSGRSDLSWDESVRLDLSYVENWTFVGDLQILWRTARAVLAGSGAY